MPQITIYVDRELFDQVAKHRIATSTVCQDALRAEVFRAQRGRPYRFRELDHNPPNPGGSNAGAR